MLLEVHAWGLASCFLFGYGHQSLIHPYSNLQLTSLISGCKEHPCPLSPVLSFGGCWRFLNGIWYLDLYLDMVTSLWYIHVPNILNLSWFQRCKENQFPLGTHLGFESWSWFGLWYTQVSNFGSLSPFWRYKEQPFPFLYVMILGILGFGGFAILKLIWIWSPVFDTPMFQILALYLDFEGAKNINVLQVIIYGFGGCILGFGILIMIWIWSLVFDTTIIQILVLLIYF